LNDDDSQPGLVSRAVRGAGRTARAVPGVRTVEALASSAGRILFASATERLDAPAGLGEERLELPPRIDEGSGDRSRAAGDRSRAAGAADATIAGTMQSLLRRSMDDTPADSRRALLTRLVHELVPDEARILAALADGSSYPMLHVAEPGIGANHKRVLENASSVGRAAGVALPELTHVYVAHMRGLGLVESGPPDDSVHHEYEILLAEGSVREAVEAVSRGPRRARILRRTIKISELGRELWESAQPPPPEFPPDDG
jgi:Abortive infection alpha